MRKPGTHETSAFSAPDLSQAFNAETELKSISEQGAEARAEQLFNAVATLYCTKHGDLIETRPQIIFSSEAKWGPYWIVGMPYSEKRFTEMSEETTTDFDADVFDGLRNMGATMSDIVPLHTDVRQVDDVTIFYFSKISELVEACSELLKQEDCPGTYMTKRLLSSQIPFLKKAIIAEDNRDKNLFPAFH